MTDEEPTAESLSQYDFKEAIERLERKSKLSRRRFYVVGFLLLLIVLLFAGSIIANLTNANYMEVQISKMEYERSREYGSVSVQEPFARRVNLLMNKLIGPKEDRWNKEETKFTPPGEDEAKTIKVELNAALDDLQKAIEVEAKKPAPSARASSGWESFISTGIFSLGAVGFVIVFIQIAVMFMRYFTRLAELYDAQADALRASNGDPEKAFKFMEHFSPNAIEIGKTPTTLYEKALDTIGQVAKK